MSATDLQPTQLRVNVATIIRSRILSGQLVAGAPIRLIALSEDLGISATPVREALFMLSHDGWLDHEPNRGFRVARIRRSDVEDIYRVWAFTEGEMSARAARAATQADVAELWGFDRQINATVVPEQALALNTGLHDLLHHIADSPRFVWFTDAARRLAPFLISDALEQVPGWLDANRTQHAPIIRAIEAADPVAARAAAIDHIEKTSQLLLDWLSELHFWSEDDSAG